MKCILCVHACVHPWVHQSVTQISIQILHLHIFFGKLLVLNDFDVLKYFLGFLDFDLKLSE